MFQWRKRYTQEADTPDFIVSKAKHYWKVYGMSGFEAAETIHRKFEPQRELPIGSRNRGLA